MGIILIIIGIIIQIALAKSSANSDDFVENASMFMVNPNVRLILAFLSWALIIIGAINLFS